MFFFEDSRIWCFFNMHVVLAMHPFGLMTAVYSTVYVVNTGENLATAGRRWQTRAQNRVSWENAVEARAPTISPRPVLPSIIFHAEGQNGSRRLFSGSMWLPGLPPGGPRLDASMARRARLPLGFCDAILICNPSILQRLGLIWSYATSKLFRAHPFLSRFNIQWSIEYIKSGNNSATADSRLSCHSGQE